MHMWRTLQQARVTHVCEYAYTCPNPTRQASDKEDAINKVNEADRTEGERSWHGTCSTHVLQHTRTHVRGHRVVYVRLRVPSMHMYMQAYICMCPSPTRQDNGDMYAPGKSVDGAEARRLDGTEGTCLRHSV